MTYARISIRKALVAVGAAAIIFLAGSPAGAHCDTLDGPVVMAARAALEKRDVTPVLKWVRPDDESEIRKAFTKALEVRIKGPEAKDLADTWFYETLVRVHRAGEGAPFTGLKPAGSEVDPAVKAADAALVSGSVDELVSLVSKEVATGIRSRYQEVTEKKKHAEENVKAGRDYVKAYVEYIHHAERLHQNAVGTLGEGDSTTAAHEHQGHHD